MKSNIEKTREILTANFDDVEILKEAGVITAEEANELVEKQETQEVIQPSAAKYYDFADIRERLLYEIGGFDLPKFEFKPGCYEVPFEYIGTLESACRTFGLKELGIEESVDGYKMEGMDEPVGSIAELPEAEKALTEYTEKVAADLNEKVGVPGHFMFGFNPNIGEGFRLFYLFQDADIPELQKMGAEITLPEVKSEEVVPASFDEIVAALEEEGCFDIAERLHLILREH